MRQPKISFVVPVYNKQAFISDCLSSLLLQTLHNIEIVVVDDKSTDDSLEVIEYYRKKDKRIKLYKLPKNVGRSEARNYGNARAKADIICVNDADDKSAFERAEVVYDFFKKHAGTDVLYTAFHISDIYGRILGKVEAVPFDYERVKKDGATYMGHSTMAYRKSKVNKIKYTGGQYCKLGLDDWKLQMDMFKAGYKFDFIDSPLVIYRQLSDSIVEIRNATEVYKAKSNYLELLKEKDLSKKGC